jgi:hypothetical protein
MKKFPRNTLQLELDEIKARELENNKAINDRALRIYRKRGCAMNVFGWFWPLSIVHKN